MKPYFIGVAGLSGSGKTALARQLVRHLPDSETITLDSYYHSQSHLTLEQRAELNYDHPDSLDWKLLAEHLATLSEGRPIEEPIYLFAEHTRGAATRTVQPRPFVIVEGILALHDSSVREKYDLSVFVTTNEAECLRRRLERDIAERGRTRESVLHQYEATVWPMALQYVLPSKEHATLVVSGEEPLDNSVAAVLKTLGLRRAAIA